MPLKLLYPRGLFGQSLLGQKRWGRLCLFLLLALAPFRNFAQTLSVAIQSSNQIAPVFGSAIFSANATGTGPFSYQWSFKNTAMPNATNSSLILGPLGFGQSGPYSVVVGNSMGQTATSQAELSVAEAIASVDPLETNQAFLLQFTNIVSASACTSFNLLRNDGTVTNEWPLDGIPRIATTNISAMAPEGLVLSSNGIALNWGYLSIVNTASNIVAIAGGCDAFLLLRADTTLYSILGQSIDLVPGLSNIVGISELGSGDRSALHADGTVTEWVSFEGPTNVPGVSNLIAVSASFRGGAGLRSDGTVVGWGDLPDDPFPGVSNIVEIAGDGVNLLALTADGSVLAGPNAPEFPCPLTNAFSIALGATGDGVVGIALVGNGTPVATVQPGNQIVSQGGTVWLHNRAVGVQPMTYQWQRNGTNIIGATDADLTLENVRGADAGQYRAIASNRLGATTSSVATISVNPVDQLAVRLGGFSVNSGGVLTFSTFTPAGSALSLTGLARLAFQASSDLAHWAPLTNFQILPNGTVSLTDPASVNSPSRFYRLTSQ
jgi:hypothetical protein